MKTTVLNILNELLKELNNLHLFNELNKFSIKFSTYINSEAKLINNDSELYNKVVEIGNEFERKLNKL